MTKGTIEAKWESHGLTCLALALDMGHRCGYVEVPKNHPWFGLGYNDRADGKEKAEDDCDWDARIDAKVDVHGNLTYSGSYPPGNPDDVEPEWWFGFDCAHLGDAKDPALMSDEMRRLDCWQPMPGDVVRTLEYVKRECDDLARQLAEVAANTVGERA